MGHELKNHGFIQTYTGSGKGKTTSAFGLAFRSIAKNWKVFIVQFLKGDDNTEYGEIKTCGLFQDKITIIQSHNSNRIVMEHNKTSEDKELVQNTWSLMVEKLTLTENNEHPFNILILDEVLPALNLGLLTQKQFFDFIREKPSNLELVLTGRIWSDSLYDKIKDISDLFSDIRCVKHYFDKHCEVCKRSFEYRSNYCPNCGATLITIPARKGIEF